MKTLSALLAIAALASSPTRAATVTDFYAELRVEAPHSYKGLAVFPLTTRRPRPLAGTLTLEQAMQRGDLVVSELGEAQVNTLRLENRGKQFVFAMGGEIIEGAKQDRTFQNDLLVPPHSGPLRVAVFCTEHGRWSDQAGRFGASRAAVPNSVRGVAKAEANQGRVWDSIAQNQRKLAVSAPSGASKDVYAAPKVQQDMGPYMAALEGLPAWHGNTVGVVAAFGRTIIAIDGFGDPALFKAMYPKLLRSYLADVLGDSWQGETRVGDVQAALLGAVKGRWGQGPTDGVGQAWRLQVGAMHGTALTFEGSLLHSDMFVPPVAQPYQPPYRENRPPNLDIRRQR